MTRYREGSRIQIMWAIFEKDGPEACVAHGPSLNLKDVTIKHWVRVWSRKKGDYVPKQRAAKIKEDGTTVKVPKRIAGYKFNPTGKKRMRCTYMKGREGWLIEAGHEVSEVRWDDDFGEIFIINKFLKEV